MYPWEDDLRGNFNACPWLHMMSVCWMGLSMWLSLMLISCKQDLRQISRVMCIIIPNGNQPAVSVDLSVLCCTCINIYLAYMLHNTRMLRIDAVIKNIYFISNIPKPSMGHMTLFGMMSHLLLSSSSWSPSNAGFNHLELDIVGSVSLPLAAWDSIFRFLCCCFLQSCWHQSPHFLWRL